MLSRTIFCSNIVKLTRFVVYRFCDINEQKQYSQSNISKSLIKQYDQGQVIQYWEDLVSKRRPNSVPIEKVLRKIYLAEVLLGSEIQDKNYELYDEIFHPKFFDRIYIPAQYENKYPTLLSLQIEVLMLEYRYRLSKKQKDQLEQVIKKIRKSLENIFQFELVVKDHVEAEFNHSNRLAMFHDLKSIVTKDIDMNKYIEEVEEQIRCLEKSVQLADQIIQHQEQGEGQLKYEMNKNLALNKIGRNFEILASILLSQDQNIEARAFLEKALEIYSHIQNELSARKIICQCRIALTYITTDLSKAIKQIQQIYNKVSEYGDSPALLLASMYYFTIKARTDFDEKLYDQVVTLLDTFAVDDPIIIPEFLSVALKFTFKEKYMSALEKHLLQTIWFVENTTEKHKLESLLQQIGEITIQLPSESKEKKNILRKVYECFEKTRNQVGDEYYWDHLLIKSFIKYNLLADDGKSQKQCIQPILAYIEESWKDDQDLHKHLKKINEFINSINLDQTNLESIYQKIGLAKASKESVQELSKHHSITK